MNIDKAIDFVVRNRERQFYQPIIFQDGVVEIEGKWNEATRLLADKLLSNVQGLKVVDIGCHVGFFVREALKRGAKSAVGYEIDPEIYAYAIEVSKITGDQSVFMHEDICRSNKLCDYFDLGLVLNLYSYSNIVNVASRYCKKIAVEHLTKDFDELKRKIVPNQVVGYDSSSREGGIKQITYIVPPS